MGTAPHADAIPVQVRATVVNLWEPLEFYRDLCGVSQDCYLLESLSGPAEDVTASVVGWGRLAEVRVEDARVTLDGVDGVVAALTRRLDAVLGPGWEVIDRDGEVWAVLRAVTRAFSVHVPAFTAPGSSLPGGSRSTGFSFGFLTTTGYGAAWDAERLPRRNPTPKMPRHTLTLFQNTAWFDLRPRRTWLLTAVGPDLPEPAPMPVPAARAGDDLRVLPPARPVRAVQDTTSASVFRTRVRSCLDHIRAGDIFQIQIGHRIDIDTELAPFDAYRRLRHCSPSPFMFVFPWAGRTVVGASPELYLRISDGRIVMRPIAGTVPGGNPDPALLRDNDKQRAEHVMLVDLCRNDVARICQPGSLGVDSFLAVERFGYVDHLVSTVSGRLIPGIDVWDVIRATFPAGTMTGAPKIRAMEIIEEEMEDCARGLYAGAVGLVDVRGFALLALCIRTAIHSHGRFSIQASAGVVADSTPEQEWDETMTKLSAIFSALTGEEIRR